MFDAATSALMNWSIFKPSVNNKISPTIAFADTLAQVLIELLPSLTATQGQQLLAAGIDFLQPRNAYLVQIQSLENALQVVDSVSQTPVIPAIDRTAFREHANGIEQWINEQFLDNKPLCTNFLNAFETLAAHRRYANATPHIFNFVEL